MSFMIFKGSFDCVTEPCHLAWLIRDNRHLLQTVHNGRCLNGTRFEDLDTNTICPLTVLCMYLSI